jgi:hypothetical protein
MADEFKRLAAGHGTGKESEGAGHIETDDTERAAGGQSVDQEN